MDLQLRGKQALVTGSTAGIGYATALGLAREGAAVTVNGRTAQRVEQAVRNLKSTVPDATVNGIASDLGTAAGVEQLIGQLPDVDILVNNLGIYGAKPFDEITDQEWLHFFEVNVLSGVRLSRRYLPGMKARDWGRVIFVASESAIQIPLEMIHYGMTKSAQLAIARGLAETTKGTNVTVNSVLPGPTSSEGLQSFAKQVAKEQNKSFAEIETEFFRSVRPSSLLQRFTTPEEVAHLIVYLCSPLASATNGAPMRVDAGVVMAMT